MLESRFREEYAICVCAREEKCRMRNFVEHGVRFFDEIVYVRYVQKNEYMKFRFCHGHVLVYHTLFNPLLCAQHYRTSALAVVLIIPIQVVCIEFFDISLTTNRTFFFLYWGPGARRTSVGGFLEEEKIHSERKNHHERNEVLLIREHETAVAL